MLQKIKTWIANKQQKRKKIVELKKAKQYYKVLKEGALFIKFIENDLKQMKKQQFNRSQRRRFEKNLESFKLDEEMIQHYYAKVDSILNYIKVQLKPIKAGQVKVKK